MKKEGSPLELAKDLTSRSICNVRVGAVLSDNHGIFGWGWNHFDGMYAVCAEQHALSRSNRKRLREATISVAAKRRGKWLTAKPCQKCAALLDKWNIQAEYTEKNNGS
jgi:cytidine deaminase